MILFLLCRSTVYNMLPTTGTPYSGTLKEAVHRSNIAHIIRTLIRAAILLIFIPVPVQTVTGSSNFDGYIVFPLGGFASGKNYTHPKSLFFVLFFDLG
jgi:hypothetical protein